MKTCLCECVHVTVCASMCACMCGCGVGVGVGVHVCVYVCVCACEWILYPHSYTIKVVFVVTAHVRSPVDILSDYSFLVWQCTLYNYYSIRCI